MLCWRCYHRIAHIEATLRGDKCVPQPRCECGDYGAVLDKDGKPKFTGSSKIGCYMFRPCFPVVTIPANGDTRPRFAGTMFAARERAIRVLDKTEVELDVVYHKNNEVALGWKVNEIKEVN